MKETYFQVARILDEVRPDKYLNQMLLDVTYIDWLYC